MPEVDVRGLLREFNRYSAVARAGETLVVTRYGKPTYVLLSVEDYNSLLEAKGETVAGKLRASDLSPALRRAIELVVEEASKPTSQTKAA